MKPGDIVRYSGLSLCNASKYRDSGEARRWEVMRTRGLLIELRPAGSHQKVGVMQAARFYVVISQDE